MKEAMDVLSTKIMDVLSTKILTTSS